MFALALPEYTLSLEQYFLVYNALSFVIASFLAAFVFFLAVRGQLSEKYRGAMIVSALVVGIAAYHYLRIFASFEHAWTFNGTVYVASGLFNDAYRYVDWLLTVPLLMVELVAVLAVSGAMKSKLLFRLSFAAALMVILGYPGEVSNDTTTRLIWGSLSTIPFLYILYVLWIQLGATIAQEAGHVRILLRNTRLLLLATWGFYPIAYLFPVIGFTGADAMVAVQLGYSIADVLAKALYGVMIYAIAREKTKLEMAGAPATNAAAPHPQPAH